MTFLKGCRKPVLIGILIGFLLCAMFMYVAFITSIHDGFRTAAYLFPISVWLSPGIHSLRIVAIFVALIQWPFYGMVVALAYKNRMKPLAVAIVACIIIQHVLIGHAASAKVNALPVRFTLEEDSETRSAH